MDIYKLLDRQKIILLAIISLFVGGLIPEALDYIAQLGHRIPQSDIPTDYIQGVLWAAFFGSAILLYPFNESEKRALFIIWFCKSLVTLGFMLMYEYIYGLDAYYYYKESLSTYFSQNRLIFGFGTQTIAWLTWVINHNLPVFDSYHSIKVVFSFIGLIGIYIFYRGCIHFYGQDKVQLLYIIGLFPSILFWSSILGKEPLTLFSFSVYCYGVFSLIKTHNYKYFGFIILGIVLSSSIRLWSVPILITPAMISIFFLRSRSKFVLVLFISACVATLLLSMKYLLRNYQINSLDSFVGTSHLLSRSWDKGGSAQEVPEFHTIGDMIRFAPLGMFTALLRPFPGEIRSIFGTAAGLENLALFVLLLLGIKRRYYRILKDPITIWAISLILIWALMYGFISYQNIGSAVRFKLQILPVMVTFILYLLVKDKSDILGLRKRHQRNGLIEFLKS